MQAQQDGLAQIGVLHPLDYIEVVRVHQHLDVVVVTILGTLVDATCLAPKERVWVLGDDVGLGFLGRWFQVGNNAVLFRGFDNLFAKLDGGRDLVGATLAHGGVQFLECLAGIRTLGLVGLALSL